MKSSKKEDAVTKDVSNRKVADGTTNLSTKQRKNKKQSLNRKKSPTTVIPTPEDSKWKSLPESSTVYSPEIESSLSNSMQDESKWKKLSESSTLYSPKSANVSLNGKDSHWKTLAESSTIYSPRSDTSSPKSPVDNRWKTLPESSTVNSSGSSPGSPPRSPRDTQWQTLPESSTINSSESSRSSSRASGNSRRSSPASSTPISSLAPSPLPSLALSPISSESNQFQYPSPNPSRQSVKFGKLPVRRKLFHETNSLKVQPEQPKKKFKTPTPSKPTPAKSSSPSPTKSHSPSMTKSSSSAAESSFSVSSSPSKPCSSSRSSWPSESPSMSVASPRSVSQSSPSTWSQTSSRSPSSLSMTGSPSSSGSRSSSSSPSRSSESESDSSALSTSRASSRSSSRTSVGSASRSPSASWSDTLSSSQSLSCLSGGSDSSPSYVLETTGSPSMLRTGSSTKSNIPFRRPSANPLRELKPSVQQKKRTSGNKNESMSEVQTGKLERPYKNPGAKIPYKTSIPAKQINYTNLPSSRNEIKAPVNTEFPSCKHGSFFHFIPAPPIIRDILPKREIESVESVLTTITTIDSLQIHTNTPTGDAKSRTQIQPNPGNKRELPSITEEMTTKPVKVFKRKEKPTKITKCPLWMKNKETHANASIKSLPGTKKEFPNIRSRIDSSCPETYQNPCTKACYVTKQNSV